MTKRIVYYDVLNIIAIIAVIALHCNGIVHGNPMIRAWDTSLIVECLCYFAVPIFYMLTGATLMRYRDKYDTKTFFKKRCEKVLIPFLIWVVIMLVWKIGIIHTISFDEINSPLKLIAFVLASKEEPIYYFMLTILGTYLVMPLLSLLAHKKYHKTLWLTVAIYFVFNALLPNLMSLFNITWYEYFNLPIKENVIYVILGYLLSEVKISKHERFLIYTGAIVGLVYHYFTTYALSKAAMVVVRATWGYYAWYTMLLAAAVFLLVKQLDFEKLSTKAKTIIAEIASCSFGVYLIHNTVIYYFVKLFKLNVLSFEYRTFGIIAVYLISLSLVYLLKHIKYLNKIVP